MPVIKINYNMYMKRLSAIVLMLGCMIMSHAQTLTTSPNRHISVALTMRDNTPVLETKYNTGKQWVTVSTVTTGLSFDKEISTSQQTLTKTSPVTTHRDNYTMLTGKRSLCMNQANCRTFTFTDAQGRQTDLLLRVYNDGMAFRYAATENRHGGRELTAFHIANGTDRWAQPLDLNGYEDFYYHLTQGSEQPNSKKKAGQWGFPLLTEPQTGIFTLITESGIRRGNSGAHLQNMVDAERYDVVTADETELTPQLSSAWRVVVVGRLADIVQSTLVTDLAEPSKIDDTSWIEPGPASWVYWAYNHGSKDFQIVRQYIDLAHDMHWPYVLIDWEWESMGNGGTIKDAIAYAQSKGVKVMVWYNSLQSWGGDTAWGKAHDLRTAEGRDKEMAWLRDMGISGVKIDFFYGDSRKTMTYYLDLLESAAKYRLLVNFHGATLPRGWQRTYPNLMTTEAVYGAEYYNNGPALTSKAAWHNAVLPFTRNVVGPMDYTPGTFSDSQNPHITSHAHELALYFLFESALQHMPDRPEAYRGLPDEVRTLLSALPTAWDDTRLLSGYPGESVVIARRKGHTWYVVGINGTDHEATLPLQVKALGKTLQLFADGTDKRSFAITPSVRVKDIDHVKCLPRGGFVAVIR